MDYFFVLTLLEAVWDIGNIIFTPHLSDVMGVIVVTSSVRLCVCLCVHLTLPAERTYRHTDLNWDMEVKWMDIQFKFAGQGHDVKKCSLGHSINF